MQLSGVRTFLDMGSLEPSLVEAPGLELEEEGLELEETVDLIPAEGAHRELAEDVGDAADVYQTGELVVGDLRKGFGLAADRTEVGYHLL